MNKDTTIKKAPEGISVKPVSDVYETEKEFNFEIEMPGVDKKNVEINFSNGVLSVKAKQNGKEQTEHSGYFRNFRFERQFSLGKDINAELIKANMDDAVLHIAVPKEAAQPPKQILVA